MATRIGELAVVRSIEIDAPPERVWEEFSLERMRLWYTTAGGVAMPCKRLELEPRVGGRFEAEGQHDEIHFLFSGEVLVYEPARELTVELNPQHEELPAPMLLTFRLTPLEDGRTLAEIIQHGFERLGDEAESMREAYEGGWNLTQLEALKGLVEG